MPSTQLLKPKIEKGVETVSTPGRSPSREVLAVNAIFAVILAVFGILTFAITPPREMPIDNRNRSPLPDMPKSFDDVKAFQRKFESYYNDRFALRTEIISLRNFFTYTGLHYSGNPKVILGNDGLLELSGNGNLETYLNNKPYRPDELESVATGIEKRRAWLAKQGIRFLFLVVPDKSTIYPRAMPSYYKPIPGPTRLDQLLAYLRKNTQVECLDLRSDLKSPENEKLLYSKTDIHWNLRGAYVAYQGISRKLKQWFPQMTGVRIVAFSDVPFSGGLAQMIGLQWLLVENDPALDKQTQASLPWRLSKQVPEQLDKTINISMITATEVAQPNLPSLVLLHDSFMNYKRQPFLPANFRRVVNVWTDEFPLNIIKAEKPDLVIEEHAECKLALGAPTPTVALMTKADAATAMTEQVNQHFDR